MKVRSYLTAGAAAVAVSAVIAAPTTVTAPQAQAPGAVHSPQVGLAASVRPLMLQPLDVSRLAAARDVVARLDPDSAFLAAAPAPQNVASDWITAGYRFIQGWVDYGVELAQYVLQFIPFGGLIGAQVDIVYYSLIRPIADSVVYDLINPVVNAPLNLSTWVNGFIDVGVTSVNALINTGWAELDYFFGWLIPPLPFAAEASLLQVEPLAAPIEETLVEPEPEPELGPEALDLKTEALPAPATAAQVDATAQVEVAPEPETEPVDVDAAQTELVGQEVVEQEVVVDEVTDPEPPTALPVTSTRSQANGVGAQGEVRTGGQVTIVRTHTTDPSTTEPKPTESNPTESKPTESKPQPESGSEPSKPATEAAAPASASPAAEPSDSKDAESKPGNGAAED